MNIWFRINKTSRHTNFKLSTTFFSDHLFVIIFSVLVAVSCVSTPNAAFAMNEEAIKLAEEALKAVNRQISDEKKSLQSRTGVVTNDKIRFLENTKRNLQTKLVTLRATAVPPPKPPRSSKPQIAATPTVPTASTVPVGSSTPAAQRPTLTRRPNQASGLIAQTNSGRGAFVVSNPQRAAGLPSSAVPPLSTTAIARQPNPNNKNAGRTPVRQPQQTGLGVQATGAAGLGNVPTTQPSNATRGAAQVQSRAAGNLYAKAPTRPRPNPQPNSQPKPQPGPIYDTPFMTAPNNQPPSRSIYEAAGAPLDAGASTSTSTTAAPQTAGNGHQTTGNRTHGRTQTNAGAQPQFTNQLNKIVNQMAQNKGPKRR